MNVETHFARLGPRAVPIVERDLTGAESLFYVGAREVQVVLSYDPMAGVSHFDCMEHGRQACAHVRLIRSAIHTGAAPHSEDFM